MKPEEALEFLDRVAAQINGPFLWQLHVQLEQAIECLRGAISKPDVEKQSVGAKARSSRAKQ